MSVFDGGTDVNSAGTEHLDSLFDDDGLAACGESVTHKICDGASGGRASGGIFAGVELHASVPVRAGFCMRTSDAVEEFCVDAIEIRACLLAERSASRAATSIDRSGTMQKDMPVEMICAGRLGSQVVDGEVEGRGEAARSSVLSRIVTEGGIVLLHGAEDAVLTRLVMV